MLDMPEQFRLEYSTEPCPRCQWHHRIRDLPPNSKVRVVGPPAYPFAMISAVAGSTRSQFGIEIGDIGVVIEVRQYVGPLYVRIRLNHLKDVNDDVVSANFFPCSLEPA